MPKLQHVSLGLLLSLAALGAQAQAGGNAPATSNATPPTPDNVGVTPQTAEEANRKAVPRTDTGTLVRTGPSVADKVKQTRDETYTAAPANPDQPAPLRPARRPRADRN